MVKFRYKTQRRADVHLIETKAYAKINLYLDIVSKQNTGFHDIESVMQTVSLADDLVINVTESQSTEIKVYCDSSYAPCGSDNIVYRAAELYLNRASISACISISLTKNIPSPAGMGGGSADAAATLRALNDVYGAFSIEELESLAARIGSDVPFCVRGGTQIARGRGEILSPCREISDCYIVAACGGEGLSTPLAYRMLDEKFGNFKESKSTDNLSVFENKMGNLGQMCLGLYNIFEIVTSECCSEMPKLKNLLLENGAVGALMCGSGPAVFGVYDDEKIARLAVLEIKKRGLFAELCTPIKKLI